MVEGERESCVFLEEKSGGRDVELVELVRKSMKCVPGSEDRTVEVHGKRRKCWELKSADG